MRRLIVATLVTSLVLSAAASAVELAQWKVASSNEDTALAYVRTGVTPTDVKTMPNLKFVDADLFVGFDYVAYVCGFIVPPQTGDYTFYTASDDDSGLWLSTDENLANATKIAALRGWCGADAWLTGGSATRTSGKRALNAGQKYAFCFTIRNGAAGGTNGSAGWMGPGILDGATITAIEGQYVDDGLGTPEAASFVSAKGAAAVVGQPATLSVGLGVSMRPWALPLKWFKVDAAGDVEVGTGATYTVAAVADTDEGSYYAASGDAKSPVVFMDVQHGLVHRYTFNEADVESIIIKDVLNPSGDFDAMLYDLSGKDTFSATGLTLGNVAQTSGAANASYVDLPNGMFSALGTQFTIEAWWTQITTGIWQRVFDIGTANGGEDKSDGGGNTAYFYLCSRKGGTGDETMWYGYKTNNSAGMNNSETNIGGQNNGGRRIPLNEEKMFAVTWDELNGVTKLYYQGFPMGHLKTRSSIRNAAQFVDNNNWIGRSQWGDTAAGGTINEFRVWDVALKANEIARHVLVGPEDTSLAPAGTCNTVATQQTMDMNQDCVVDMVDYAMLVEAWLDSVPQTAASAW